MPIPTDSWINKSEFTLADVTDVIKSFQAKGFKGAVGIAFDESIGTQIEDTNALRTTLNMVGSDTMQGLLFTDKPDLTVDRILEMLPSPEAPSATVLRAFTELWRNEPKHGMCVFTSPFHLWKNALNGKTVIMGMPDRLCYLSAALFMQTAVDKFQLARIDYTIAPGGAQEYLI